MCVWLGGRDIYAIHVYIMPISAQFFLVAGNRILCMERQVNVDGCLASKP